MKTTLMEIPHLGVFEQLANYGVLGIAALALGALGWYFIKKNVSEKERLQAKIDELEKELRSK